MYTTAVLKYQISLRIIDTQLCAKGVKNICELWYVLVPSLSQSGPLYVFILIAIDKVILLINDILEIIPSICS